MRNDKKKFNDIAIYDDNLVLFGDQDIHVKYDWLEIIKSGPNDIEIMINA